MNAWNGLIQDGSWSHGTLFTCSRFEILGVTVPFQVAVIACDAPAEATATALVHQLRTELLSMSTPPVTLFLCHGPGGLNCMSWKEPACKHVLVMVIGSTPLGPGFETMADDWVDRGGLIMPVLMPGLQHAQVFGTGAAFPVLSKANQPSYLGSVTLLSQLVLEAILLERRRGVFLSYVRNDASAAAEQVFDALQRRGFRVFMDRFSGTPGLQFPAELAQAMGNADVVLALETAHVAQPGWTMWEVRFAHKYKLGPLAVNFQRSPKLRQVRKFQRLPVDENPSTPISALSVQQIADFVAEQVHLVSIGRRAYFETLARLAAQSKSGRVARCSNGALNLVNRLGSVQAALAISGAPAQTGHIRRVSEASLQPPVAVRTKLVAGDHQHLLERDLKDLQWLASETGVTLTGAGSMYRHIRTLL
ncbi:toll/interleukin-1 receptor domain-containing protein [Variovorax rhizosphaerae]|uniref:Toll/interleukin-1 receptor domain-containing protein n=1 Tax=Variovorax rhizosphaerae TaxID=1836200 RepID=A0ABU8WMP8_9BURK